MFFRWLRSLQRTLGLTESKSRRGRARGDYFRRLEVEGLEDRTVPSTAVPTLSNVSITSALDLGSQTTLSGTINGPATEHFTLDVNWGDGTGTQTYILPAGTTTFSEPYT
jgi:hypothetical protein